MKKLFCLTLFLLLISGSVFTQDNCISVTPSVCIDDCLPVTYIGSAPPSATYTWSSSCGTFDNPNQQDPGNHCFQQVGTCTLQLIVMEPGLEPDTCFVFVEVNDLPEGNIEEDADICSGECAQLITYFSAGTPPFVYQVDDGFNTFFYTSSGFSDTIMVCPQFTTSYTLAGITGSGNCQGDGPFNSVTVTVLSGVTASVTQNDNMLCANPPNQDYEWWDCSFNQVGSTDPCITIANDTCLCLIVSNGSCADTLCGEYILPCDLTCEIGLNDSICNGDSVIFAYTGNASSNASFDWFIDLPGMPGFHFTGNDTVILAYNQVGCYGVLLTVTDGICITTCSDSVCVFDPVSEATFGPDIVACEDCTTINVFLTGVAPWNIILSDGNTNYSINGITFSPYPFVVCPPQDSTVIYTLVEVTDSMGICPAVIIDDSVSVILHENLIANVTQIDNTLCADTITGTYAWYDCGFTTLLDTNQCFSIPETGCYCLVVANGLCEDTLCAEYTATPCELTCNIEIPDSVCIVDSVLFVYTGNASPTAVFNWGIDLPGFPGTPFTGNDTIAILYDQPGCYQASVTVFDAGCIVTCLDSVCVVAPKSEVSICCDEEKCDTCTTIEITLTGAAPWNIYISNGSAIDSITGITSSPYNYVVCPPADSTVTYTIVQVTDSCNICPAVIAGDTSVTITLHAFPVASIIQNGDTLCANPPNMAGYGWYTCPSGAYLSIAQCFVPTVSGCYCVDVSTADDCVDTACIDIVVGVNLIGMDNEISIFPNPSKEGFNVNFENAITSPIQWCIYSLYGQLLDHGMMEKNEISIRWKEGIPPGIYLFELNQGDQKFYSTRLVRQ